MAYINRKFLIAFSLSVFILMSQNLWSAEDNLKKCLNLLGPDRGAKTLSSESSSLSFESSALNSEQRKILGVVKGVKTKSENLKKQLKDLEAEESKHEFKVQLSGDVLFDFDKATLRSQAEKTLKKVGQIIEKYKSPKVIIVGHTDSKGAESYNQKLSEERAISVKKYFVEKLRLTKTSYLINGYGESRPIAPNTLPNGKDNPEGRQKNRRVEIVIKK